MRWRSGTTAEIYIVQPIEAELEIAKGTTRYDTPRKNRGVMRGVTRDVCSMKKKRKHYRSVLDRSGDIPHSTAIGRNGERGCTNQAVKFSPESRFFLPRWLSRV